MDARVEDEAARQNDHGDHHQVAHRAELVAQKAHQRTAEQKLGIIAMPTSMNASVTPRKKNCL